IRTPMNAIIGMTDLALDTELTREQREYLQTVQTSGEALLTLINDILDLSKVEAGQLSMEAIDFSLRATVEPAVVALGVRAHGKGLELLCHISPECPDALLGDPGRLRQILVNLIGNAIKFTGRGEVVLHVNVEDSTDSEVVLGFAVTDTGIGIPADQLDAVFEVFTQVDSSATREYSGTGLGLAISQRIVEVMGGGASRSRAKSAAAAPSSSRPVSRSARRHAPCPRQRPRWSHSSRSSSSMTTTPTA
ncbi:MAG TPA: ATP-binding protein, partial [Armatimonadota bacterium]|nr:ATP-binding protein [Armatimonadota bacterium]